MQVLNGSNGRPMKGQSVWVYCGRPSQSTPFKRATNEDGIATFVLPERPITELFLFDSLDVHQCSQPSFLLSDILLRGVVAHNNCDLKRKLVETIKAKPGEVVIFVKPARWWEGMR